MKTLKFVLLQTRHILCLSMMLVISLFSLPQFVCAQSTGVNVLFILDGSGSMWGRLDNVEKIVIAKKRMIEWVQDWENANMGLIVYGHHTKGDCDDIEVLVPLGPGNQERIITQIQSINPKGKTPIQRSIALAAKHLETIEEETAIVLVSDGLETCDPDPCGYVKHLKDEKGIAFTLDVVGFDVKDEEREQLECLANAGGGRYYSAKNAMQLKEAFTEVKKEVVKKVETKPAGPQPGDVWTEPVTGMEFVWIPGGCFQMGQSEQEKQELIKELSAKDYKYWYGDRGIFPRHHVCVDGFWMGKCEVTNAQYRTWKTDHDSGDVMGESMNQENQPVVKVNWKDADAFAKWLTQQQENNLAFRLPTEAEWEYAARAGTTTPYFWGDDLSDICQYANIADQSAKRQWPDEKKYSITYYTQCDDGYTVTAPVGSFRPNPFGLYDMIGNVFEFCQDWYDPAYYAQSPSQNPQGPISGKERVGRGGSWLYYPFLCRLSYRGLSVPDEKGGGLNGFRLVRVP